MKSSARSELLASGLGVVAAIGSGQNDFASALFAGRSRFGVMARPGRQKGTALLGAEIGDLPCPPGVDAAAFASASLPVQAALTVLAEAWRDARLDGVDPQRIGLVIGGSNLQQRDLVRTVERYAERVAFVRPSHAVGFMDTDLCGACSEQFGIRGFACTLGGASASGQLALSQAMLLVAAGEVDACIAIGALADLSYLECQAFRSLGAMGSDRFADQPLLACRPFDALRDGFVYGEACGAVVVERAGSCSRPDVAPWARLSPCATVIDANRKPNPSLEGEVTAIAKALQRAGLTAGAIDYVNPHGSGSVLGDEVELQALRRSGLAHARINTTKSIVGHSLSAAGMVEVIATLLQMRASRLHPSLNLVEPIDAGMPWVGAEPAAHRIERALCLSLGFGGINSALCIERL